MLQKVLDKEKKATIPMNSGEEHAKRGKRKTHAQAHASLSTDKGSTKSGLCLVS